MIEMFGFPITLELVAALVGGLVVVTVFLLVLVIVLFIRLRSIFRGAKARDLEALITELSLHKDEAVAFHKHVMKIQEEHSARIGNAVATPPVLRFDAFNGTGEGGKQSFATALVSEKGDGMVLSSLYMRDKMRIYAKPVEQFTSSFELTEEEQEVLTQAKRHHG